MSDKYKPIFIHSLPRSSSTYFWNKFRTQDKYKTFYEPFHDALQNNQNKEKNIKLLNETNIYFKHEFMKDNPDYFEEYKNLYINNKMNKFNLDFSFKMADLNFNDNNQFIFDYLNTLINESISNNKIPVLKFIRTFLRLEWINKNFKTLNIYLLRNSRDIYQSFLEVAGKKLLLLTIFYNNNKLLFLRKKFKNKLKTPKDNFSSISNYDFYYIVYYINKLYKNTVYKIVKDNDIIINVSNIENNIEYKNNIVEKFNENNISINIDDFKYNKYSKYLLNEQEFDSIEDEINNLFKRDSNEK